MLGNQPLHVVTPVLPARLACDLKRRRARQPRSTRCREALLMSSFPAPKSADNSWLAKPVTPSVIALKCATYGYRYMRVAAELRDDGVYVAAGVELIEPESRWTSPNVPGHVFVTPSKTARVGDKLGWQAEQRLRAATRSDEYGPAGVRRTQMLKRCACSAVFVGDPGARNCPACKRAADLAATRAAVRRMRARGAIWID